MAPVNPPCFMRPQLTTDGEEGRSDLGPTQCGRPREQVECWRALPSQVLPIMVSKPAFSHTSTVGFGGGAP